jgi:predicted NBD/HSP70 family sugar kinase
MVTGKSQQAIERIHEAEIICALANAGEVSRAELAERAGLGRSTVSQVLATLIERGTVVAGEHQKQGGRGRPSELVGLDRDAVSAIGIDLAHAWVHITALNVLGDVIATTGRPVEDAAPWPERIAVAQSLLADLDVTPEQMRPLRALAVGLFGPIHIDHQWVHAGESGNGPSAYADESWYPYVEGLSARYACPVMIDNTIRFAAYAEHLAMVQHPGDATLHVRLFHGVGGAVVGPEGIERGASGMGGEIGHMTVDRDGDLCRCGRRGCLETFASTSAVLRACRRSGLAVDTVADLRIAVQADDPRAINVLTRAGRALGEALIEASILVDPARIIVSGDIVQLDDTVLRVASETCRAGLGPRFAPAPVTRGVLGEVAASRGGALAVIRQELPALDSLRADGAGDTAGPDPDPYEEGHL